MDVAPGFTAISPTSLPPVSTGNATSNQGAKRKRDMNSAPKFYAVRVGKEPGIYHTWADCLDQVRGFPKAVFKSFTSLTDAESFLNNEGDGESKKPTKWYGVRSGRKPGVYRSWQEVLDQIRGWKAPKHRVFKTSSEAEQYVADGLLPPSAAESNDVPVGSIEPLEPLPKKQKATKAKKGTGIKQEGSSPLGVDQGEYNPGEAPLPDDVEDGFDSWIVLDPTTNGVRYRTREERERVTYRPARPVSDAPIRIYTDGSSLSNGQTNAWGGVGVYFGPADKRNISEPLNGSKQTNQRAELTAIARALEVAPKDRRIVIISDSKYAIDCVTDWFHNWQKNGWITSSRKPVENKDLVQKVLEMLEERIRLNKHRMEDGENVPGTDKRAHWDRGPGGVRFEWVKGHDKDEGNTAADSLAVAGARTAQELDEVVSFDE